MGPIIGIDLGTKSSCIVTWLNGHEQIIKTDQNESFVPSCVSFSASGYLVGKSAEDQMLSGSHGICDIKRVIGQGYKTVKGYQDYGAFIICDDGQGFPKYEVNCGNVGSLYPEQLSAMILKELKLMAERNLKEAVKKVVITVPAYFNDSQKNSTKMAAVMAGLEVLKVISEPAAAALAYGTSAKVVDKNVLVYDLGI